jgi:hypothetical protein
MPLAMRSPPHGTPSPLSAVQTWNVITAYYRELVIFVPKWSKNHSKKLIGNQEHAIDLGAVLRYPFESQKCTINPTAVAADNLVKVRTIPHMRFAPEPFTACFYPHIPPIESEHLHTVYPGFAFFSLLVTGSPIPEVVASIFGVPQELWGFVPLQNRNDKMEVVKEKHLKWLKKYLEINPA